MENPLQFFTNKESSRADPDYGGVKEEDVLQEESFVTIKVENEDELMDEDSAEASMTIIEDEVIIKMEPIDGVEKSGFSEIEVKTEHDPIDHEVQERPIAGGKRRQGKEEKKHLKKSRKGIPCTISLQSLFIPT
ncbi:hypothetical protein GE061_012772 [Apolygus lucorum]|uniref:Uncharacterized protein n=1 Tax=Apolygus lucorum TaxID=248454 RepID=A0A8S9XVB9_APOLU|nr:hypothetical protein GE061_012772 [Apolygus lucorum]